MNHWKRFSLALLLFNMTAAMRSKEGEPSPHITILIDPGHGGLELGASATSPTAYREKELALATARYLQSDLQQLGYNATLTRDSDKTLTLQQRVALANKKAIDLFVSVHYNSAPSVQASGIEVFLYRKEGDARMPLSEELAAAVLKGVIEKTAAVSRGVKHGNFAVIRETKVPAILVEGGFLTNTQELSLILDKNYQKKIARGIALGIERYLAERRVEALP